MEVWGEGFLEREGDGSVAAEADEGNEGGGEARGQGLRLDRWVGVGGGHCEVSVVLGNGSPRGRDGRGVGMGGGDSWQAGSNSSWRLGFLVKLNEFSSP